MLTHLHNRLLQCLLTLVLATSTGACQPRSIKIERAFYYWKSNPYNLDDKELLCLKNNQVEKLYVKFFEVDKDDLIGAKPTSKTDLHIWHYTNDYDHLGIAPTLNKLEIVPVVFVRNKVLSQISSQGLDSLADNVVFLIDKYYKQRIKNRDLPCREIQIDCDWTATTRDNYFYLLKKIKALSGKTLSCTLRLYPYKYRDEMGVPPVDKAVLMCYNLTNPLASEKSNSILDNRELAKYLAHAPSYPIHIDFALPLFSWMQVYQHNQFAGLIQTPRSEIDTHLKPIDDLWDEVTSDIEIDNLYLRPGDRIKHEDIDSSTVREAISLLKKHVEFDTCHTLIFFHLDANNLKKFDDETLSGFYSQFAN